ncbi:MAG: hypothetical protein ACR2NQ_05850 [Thermodesulfobacteriota bacterium]
MLPFLLLAGVLVLASPAAADDHTRLSFLNNVSAEAYAGWDSQYVLEGRDDGGGYGSYAAGVAMGYKGFSVFFDHFSVDKNEYTELNYGIGYETEFQGVGISLGYARFDYPAPDSEDADNQFSAEIAYGSIPYISPWVSFAYHIEEGEGDENGSFAAIGTSVDIPEFGIVTVSPYAFQAFDLGYRYDGKKGANNFQVGVEASLALWEKVALVSHINHSFKQKTLKASGDAAVGTWGGVSMSFSM